MKLHNCTMCLGIEDAKVESEGVTVNNIQCGQMTPYTTHSDNTMG